MAKDVKQTFENADKPRKPDGKFIKGVGGPGRPKGIPNRSTLAIRDMILEALDRKGGVDYLERIAEEKPSDFVALLIKIMPKPIEDETPAPQQPNVVVFAGGWNPDDANKFQAYMQAVQPKQTPTDSD